MEPIEWPNNADYRCPRCGQPFLKGVWMKVAKDDDYGIVHAVCPGADGYDEVRRRIAEDDGTRYTLEEVAAELGIDPTSYDGRSGGDGSGQTFGVTQTDGASTNEEGDPVGS